MLDPRWERSLGTLARNDQLDTIRLVSRSFLDRSELAPLLDAIEARLPGVLGIWLFGSLARGDQHRASDIDLAVLARGALDPVQIFDLGLELGDLANRDVDLLDLRRVSTVMRKEIVTEGVLIRSSDAPACEAFASASLALFVALQEERLDRESGSSHRRA